MRSVQSIYSETQALLEGHAYQAALQASDAGLHAYPEEGRLWEMRGIALRRLGRIRQAMNSLETATTMVPLSPAGQLALANSYCHTGNLESAECIFVHLTTRNDVPTAMLAELAFGLGQVGKLSLALDACQKAVQRMPDCDQAWMAMAYFMARLEYSAEQISEVLSRALTLCPNPVLYRIDFALLLLRCERAPQAYGLLCEVEVHELLSVRCPPRLNGLVQLFRNMGDDARANACESHAKRIQEQWKAGP